MDAIARGFGVCVYCLICNCCVELVWVLPWILCFLMCWLGVCLFCGTCDFAAC